MKTVCVLSVAALLLSVNVVTGRDLTCSGSCVGTWKKCAGQGIASGTIRPCCNKDDHCVQKTSKFSQCRPKSRDIPSSWPSGAILTCADPPACDPTVISSRLGGLSANRFADNDDIELDFFYVDELDIAETTCMQECQDNDECFAFDETVDGDCTLFGKNLFTTAGNLQPFFDAELFLTKCFLPEPLCDPATREVRRVNPILAPGGGFHQMASNSDIRDFFVTPASYTLTAAINACRLNGDRLGGCIGFAIEPSTGRDGEKVTLLYNAGRSTVSFRGDLADNPQVYSIAECL